MGGFGAGLTSAAMGLLEDFRASLLAGFFALGRKEIFAIDLNFLLNRSTISLVILFWNSTSGLSSPTSFLATSSPFSINPSTASMKASSSILRYFSLPPFLPVIVKWSSLCFITV